MDKLTIEGIPAYNGEYPLDMTYFTNRELHLIKEVAGVRAGELQDAFVAGDNDLMVAIAAIAIQRKTGEKVNVDALWDAEAGKFTLDVSDPDDAEGGDALPPESEPDESESDVGKTEPAGVTSNGTSALPPSVQSPTGVPV